MSVSAAYLAVILIWSTTPLGIIFSSETVNPTLAVLLRMLIAGVLGMLIVIIARIRFPWHKQARKLYLFSSIGIFGGMMLSYLAGQYISSGVMSLSFGLAPIISGLLSQKILKEAVFGPVRVLAMVISVLGLALVCSQSITFGDDSYIGMILVLMAVFLFSLSGVLVKSVQVEIHPIATTVGALLLCMPLFTVAWIAFGAEIGAENWSAKSMWSIIYLGVFGSLIGFIAYFYVLQKLAASTVALITMITPVIAICLGAFFNNEPISAFVVIGAVLVMTGLGLYHFGQQYVIKRQALANQT